MNAWLVRARSAWSGFLGHDLRWSYLVVAAGLVLGLGINLLLPHGWTVWPGVAMVGLLVYVHEAADRNGQGVPPLFVYGLFVAGAVAWVLVTALLAAVNPLILLTGIGVMAYLSLRAILREWEWKRLVQERREQGRCVHCGELADAHSGLCSHCGQEPDPELLLRQRVQAVVQNSGGGKASRARAVLRQETLSVSARRKEAALIRARELRKPGTSRRR